MGIVGSGVGGAAAASFDGKITSWPSDQTLNICTDQTLNICNVPVDEKSFVRYIAAEWYKNQSIDSNPRAIAQQAITNAQTLFNQLHYMGYI